MKTPFLDSARISVHISYSSDNKTRHGGAQLLVNPPLRKPRQEDCYEFQTNPGYIGTYFLNVDDDNDVTVRLPSKRPTEVASLCSETPAPESPRVLPWMSFHSLYLFLSSLAFISQLHRASGQGQIKVKSWLRELNLTAKSLSPVKRLSVQPRNLPSDSCRERRRKLL